MPVVASRSRSGSRSAARMGGLAGSGPFALPAAAARAEGGTVALLLLGQLASVMDTASAFFVKLMMTRYEAPRFPILQYAVTYIIICVGALAASYGRSARRFPDMAAEEAAAPATAEGVSAASSASSTRPCSPRSPPLSVEEVGCYDGPRASTAVSAWKAECCGAAGDASGHTEGDKAGSRWFWLGGPCGKHSGQAAAIPRNGATAFEGEQDSRRDGSTLARERADPCCHATEGSEDRLLQNSASRIVASPAAACSGGRSRRCPPGFGCHGGCLGSSRVRRTYNWLCGVFAVRSTAFYLVLGMLDVQGGILSVLAVQHASLATVCLIDWVAVLTAFLLSVALLKETVNRFKISALSLGMLGSLCILYSDAASYGGGAYDGGGSGGGPAAAISMIGAQGVRGGPVSATSVAATDFAFQPSRIFGDVMSLGSAVFFGIVTVMMEKAMLAGASRNELLLNAFGAATWAALVQLLFFEAPRLGMLREMTVGGWSCFIAAACSLAVCYALAPIILEKCSSAFFNMSLLSSAGLAVLLSSLVFGEPFPALYIIGLLAILVSLMLYHTQEGKRPVADADGNVLATAGNAKCGGETGIKSDFNKSALGGVGRAVAAAEQEKLIVVVAATAAALIQQHHVVRQVREDEHEYTKQRIQLEELHCDPTTDDDEDGDDDGVDEDDVSIRNLRCAGNAG